MGCSGQLAPWILWFLWLARNDYVFNNKEATPEMIITKAVAAAWEWLAEQSSNRGPPLTPYHTEPNQQANATLVQTDAAWRRDLQLAGLGWIMGAGDRKHSFLAHCHYVDSPLVAEGLALREALACCIEKGLRHVRCESDSFKLIKTLNKGSPLAELYGIVADILCLATAFDSISFVWIQRSKNRDADALAKQALYNESSVMNLDG